MFSFILYNAYYDISHKRGHCQIVFLLPNQPIADRDNFKACYKP